MARCTKCGVILYRSERSNITMDREAECGWKHKDCDKAVGKPELEAKPRPAPTIQPLPLKGKKEPADEDKKYPPIVSDKNLKDKKNQE